MAADEVWRSFAGAVRERSVGVDPGRVVSGIVAALARHHGWTVPDDLRIHRWTPLVDVAELDLPELLANPWLPGRVLEATLDAGVRQASGAHYTPPSVAAGLTALAFEAAGAPTPLAHAGGGRVPAMLDPACGGGAFLLAAADWLCRAGFDPGDVVRHALWGVDREPAAAAATEAAMALWAWQHGDLSGRHPGEHVSVGDALGGASSDGTARWPPDVDVVVGNPPFLGQLGRQTARTREEAATLRAELGSAVGAYTDAAALFLLVGIRAVRVGGTVSLVLPTSVLAARDAAPVRAAVLGIADLVGLWTADDDLFEASVRVCAPVLRRRSEGAAPVAAGVSRWHGSSFTALDAAKPIDREAPDGSWSPLVADLQGVPSIEPAAAGTLADLATATAGFRGEYYALVDHVTEAADEPRAGLAPLVTVGLIDVGRCAWGERDARFARQRWRRPAVDLDSLRAADQRVAEWVDDLQVAKVVVATQTRVGEAAVDEAGTWVPSVPTIAVVAPADRLWAVAAVVCSPVATALAVQRTAGSALSGRAIKLSARQVLDLPCPAHRRSWDEGADALRAGDLDRFADAMAAAYGLATDHPVTAWWHERRLPARAARR